MTNAIKFIQQHGVEKAREVVEGAPARANHYCADNYWFWDGTTLKRSAGDGFFIHSIWGASEEWVSKAVNIPELKRLVDSVDIIKELGSLESAKANLREMYSDSSCDWVHEKARLYDYKHLTVGQVKQAIADYESIGGEHV